MSTLPLSVEQIVLGTVQLGMPYGINNQNGKPSQEQAFAILDEAWRRGVRELDTAAGYGDSETIIGSWEKSRGHQFKIMSKAAELNEKNFVEKIQQSCKNLGVETLEGFYFHKFSDFREMSKSSLLSEVKTRGLIKNLAVSLYDIEDLRLAVSHPDVDVIQLPYNLLDRSEQKRNLLKDAKTKGKRIYARSVFLQGLFFMDTFKLPAGLTPLKENLNELHEISQRNDLSMDLLALNFVLQSSCVDKALIGVESLEQLTKNLNAILPSGIDVGVLETVNAMKVGQDHLLNPANWGNL